MPIFITLLLLVVTTLPTHAYHPRIMFDQGHGQTFLIEDETDLHLSSLAQTFVDLGYEVSSSKHPLTADLLDTTDALVISGAATPFSIAEIILLYRFIEHGGRVAIMLQSGPPMKPLLAKLGVEVANGIIREEQNIVQQNPLNFKASNVRPHPVTRGLKDFSVYGCWPVRPITRNGTILAYSSSRSWLDLSGDQRKTPGDSVQAFGLLVENQIARGKLLVFGDNELFQNRLLITDNRELAKNLGHWLAAGKRPMGEEI